MNSREQLVFLEGRHVRLRVLTKEDVLESPWVGWFNSEYLCRYNLHHYFPISFDSQLEFLRSPSPGTSIALGVEAANVGNSLCGIVALNNIDLIHRNAEIAGMLDETRTRGYPDIFLEAWSLIIRHGFEQLGLRKVYGGSFRPGVFEALQRAFNFELEGYARDHVYKSGRFHTVTRFSVLSDSIRYPHVRDSSS